MSAATLAEMAALDTAPAAEGRDRAARLAGAAAALAELGVAGDHPVGAWVVPGRIEVLGKHTDYAGGRSLVAATEQGLVGLCAPRTDDRLRMIDVARGERLELELGGGPPPPGGHWGVYPATVGRRLADDFGPRLLGCDLAFSSDLPAAAGLSSSSALVTAVYLALAEANGLDQHPVHRREIRGREALAGYLGAVESGAPFGSLGGGAGVGTFGGSEDHTAILCSRAGELRRYRYCPVQLEETVPWPADRRFAIAVSGLHAHKAGPVRMAYNRASELARAAARCWRRASGRDDPHLGAALAAAPAAEVRRALATCPEPGFTGEELMMRFNQFSEESERLVPAAAAAVAAGDLERLGRLAARSQRLAEERLGNQVPETAWLARAARRLGAPAASAFGAGWGGSVWALVEAAERDRFLAAWRAGYLQAFPERGDDALFFATAPAAGAREVTRP